MKKGQIIALVVIVLFVTTGVLVAFGSFEAELNHRPSRASTVGQQEIASYFVGLANRKPYGIGGAGVNPYTCYEYEGFNTKTAAYSPWNPNWAVNQWGKRDFNSYSFEWDIDGDISGMPDVQAKIVSQYTSTADGTPTDTFISEVIPLEFYDPVLEKTRTIKFYKTYTTSQISIKLNAGYLPNYDDGKLTGATSEFYGKFTSYPDVKTTGSFGGLYADFRLALRMDLKNWQYEDYVHIDPELWDTLGNAVLSTRITDINLTDVSEGSDWNYETMQSGDTMLGKLDMYATLQDALLQSSTLPDKEDSTIKLEDTLYSSVYYTLDYAVLLGCNMIENWYNFVTADSQPNWMITVSLTNCIIASFKDHVEVDSFMIINNPFSHDEVDDDRSWWEKALGWLSLKFGVNEGTMIIILIAIVIGIGLIVLFVAKPDLLLGIFSGLMKGFGKLGTGFVGLFKKGG